MNWDLLSAEVQEQGFALSDTPVLNTQQCTELRGMCAEECHFRKRIQMERFRFGVGDYQHFAYPLPDVVEALRHQAYAALAPIANEWMARLGDATRFPAALPEYLATCHAAGQTRPTPLLLHYSAGGYNCLHQDLYGEQAFPFQVVVQLSVPDRHFTGGEFLLVEQRPRAQSIGTALQPTQGQMIAFTTRNRPVHGLRGYYRANVKHGVSRVRSGERYTLGVIFHDAA